MKHVLTIAFILLCYTSFAQSRKPSTDLPLTAYAGDYGTKDSTTFNIIYRDDKLYFNTTRYGKIPLLPRKDHLFQLEHVQPQAFFDFIADSSGAITSLVIRQKGKFTWLKIPDSSSKLIAATGKSAIFTGTYRQDIDLYNTIRIIDTGGRLQFGDILLEPITTTTFRPYNDKNNDNRYVFTLNKEKAVTQVVVSKDHPEYFIKRSTNASAIQHISNRQNGFTRADSVRGMLTPLRTCYDVLFYELDVTIDPGNRLVSGHTVIRFRSLAPSDSIQIDLYANMKIEKILYRQQELSYSRAYNAVFVHLPEPLHTGAIEEIDIYYAGKPQLPEIEIMSGGFFWMQNREGKPWIESVCQGAGASLWWPCKDHLSDEPDSMKISITVPRELDEISNGRLLKKTVVPDNKVRYDWYVSYPINNYNVAVNIGDYVHFTDQYIRGHDTLALNYHCMPYNLSKAKQLFQYVKPMLTLFEKLFGPYPFPRDGFTVMESVYPMEHQGAVSIGYFNQPFNSDQYDSSELKRLMWHEVAHEWWGNSITNKDMADMWIHESFATYAEVLAYEAFSGKEAMMKYLSYQHPSNKEPIIGVYDVNHFHMGDMYGKGALMLHTFRNVLNNDTLWFGILKGLQEHFRYQTVTTEDIVGFINKAAQKNYTSFFDQYLRFAAIPELQLQCEKQGNSLQVKYKWNVDVKDFNMPVKITTSKNRFQLIYPTTQWQTMKLADMNETDMAADTDNFYIRVKK